MSEQRMKTAYCFDNGMVMAFDQHGQQMPDYQGRYEEVIDKIRHDFPDVNVKSVYYQRAAG